MNKIILTFALAFLTSIFLASAVSAYDVKYTVNMDKSGFDYELYQCTSSTCAAVTGLIQNGTAPGNSVTFSYSTTGTQYYAFYLYEVGYRYMQGIIKTDSKYTHSVSGNFVQKQNCKAALNVSAPSTLNESNPLQVYAIVQSAFQSTLPGSGLPLYEPTTHSSFMESDVRTTLSLSNSSGIIKSTSEVQSIWLSHSADYTLSIPNIPAGNYTLTVRTDCMDNQCNMSNAIPSIYTTTITVLSNPPNPNNIPVITTLPPTSVVVNNPYVYDINATDADNDVLTYALVTSPGMLINSATGLINWMPTIVGDYPVNISVTDGKDTVTQVYILHVLNQPNHAPNITFIPNQTAILNQPYSYPVIATDADNDSLNYSITTLPVTNMSINPTGMISWTPTAVGNYSVSVSVTDGKDTTTQDYTLTVNNATHNNTSPTITITGPADNSELDQGSLIHFSADVHDAEDPSSTLIVTWTSNIDDVLGTGSSIDIDWLSVGTHYITARVTDLEGASSTAIITLTIKETNSNTGTSTSNKYIGEYSNLEGLLVKNTKQYIDNSNILLGESIAKIKSMFSPVIGLIMLLIFLMLILILLIIVLRKKR